MSTEATILLVISFAAGFVWTARMSSQLGIVAFVLNLLAAASFYFALGLLPGFLEWMNANDYTDRSIRALIWSGIVTVPFFLGTVTAFLFKELGSPDSTDRRND